ncbi:MAG: TetR-like C-terminal domain-containing protein [Rubrivivax sp.]|nr:TetR-like C-terminal domain-containing protein [Rubrivivax sp.]
MALRMQHYAQAAGDSPAQRLAAVGRACVDFALDSPAQTQLMFRSDRLDAGDPALKQASAATAQALALALAWSLSVALKHRGVNTQTLQERCLLAWSAVHGLAMLVLDADLGAFGLANDREGSVRSAAAALLGRQEMVSCRWRRAASGLLACTRSGMGLRCGLASVILFLPYRNLYISCMKPPWISTINC